MFCSKFDRSPRHFRINSPREALRSFKNTPGCKSRLLVHGRCSGTLLCCFTGITSKQLSETSTKGTREKRMLKTNILACNVKRSVVTTWHPSQAGWPGPSLHIKVGIDLTCIFIWHQWSLWHWEKTDFVHVWEQQLSFANNLTTLTSWFGQKDSNVESLFSNSAG